MPRPPLLLGGGSPRMLTMSGELADIVSIVPSLRARALESSDPADVSAPSVAEKLT